MVQRDRGRVVLYKFSVVEGDSGLREGGCVRKISIFTELTLKRCFP